MTQQAPDFSASVLRADDLLVLGFDFFNLKLDSPAGQPPRLVRVTPGQPSSIVVTFPPQHIAEQLFDENDQGQLGGLVAPPVRARLAGRTRLAFDVPPTIDSLPFTLESLVDWSQLTPAVAPNALPDPPPPLPDPPSPAEPSPTTTAIELPYRLVLSPDTSARWAHSTTVVVHDAVAELWHTRLGTADATGQVDETLLPTLRAIWAVDMQRPVSDPPPLALSAEDRQNIASATSDFSFFPSAPLHATHLVLSALGAWTDIRGAWDAPGDSFPLAAWRQVIAMGRDQYVRLVSRGFLYPLGHRALLVQVTERTLRQAPDGTQVDFLVRRTQVVVQEPLRDYAQLSASHPRDHQLPLRRARITTLVTPVLDALPDNQVFLPRVGGQPFPFHVQAEDWLGQPVDLSMPLVFTPVVRGGVLDGLAEYLDINNVNVAGQQITAVDMRGQQVALAPDPPSPGATTLKVQNFVFTGVSVAGLNPPFLPLVEQALVHMDAVDHLLGSSGAPAAVPVNLQRPDPNRGDVFAKLVEPAALSVPPEKAGGIVAPNLSIDGLSRARGPLPPVADDLAGGRFDPTKLFGSLEGTNLLGGISLGQLISSVASFDQVPSLRQVQLPDAVEVRFDWQPRIQPVAPLKLKADPSGPDSMLRISAVTRVPLSRSGDAGEPTFLVDGLLTNFALEFFGIARVTFAELHFHAEKGRKVDVDPKGVNLEFENALSFLNELANVLPANGFSDPPSLSVTAEGVRAGYSLQIPSAGIGVFSLEHLSLSTELALPFVDKPAGLRLAFSERAHPFLVTVAMIGGGGYFAMELDTRDIQLIEGAIELGANLTVDLAVVEANVHIMAGFYFAIKRTGQSTQLDFSAYLRIGGAVELLGIAGLSIEIYLALTYEGDMQPPSIGGRAAVTVGVHLLMFTTSVTLSTERHFPIPGAGSAGGGGGAGPGDPTFDDLIDPTAWQTYCQAFA
jgi:hypothetical protein